MRPGSADRAHRRPIYRRVARFFTCGWSGDRAVEVHTRSVFRCRQRLYLHHHHRSRHQASSGRCSKIGDHLSCLVESLRWNTDGEKKCKSETVLSILPLGERPNRTSEMRENVPFSILHSPFSVLHSPFSNREISTKGQPMVESASIHTAPLGLQYLPVPVTTTNKGRSWPHSASPSSHVRSSPHGQRRRTAHEHRCRRGGVERKAY